MAVPHARKRLIPLKERHSSGIARNSIVTFVVAFIVILLYW